MSNPYPKLPQDKNGMAMQEFQSAKKATDSWLSENATASSVLLLGHDTTALEIHAVDKDAVIRWVAATGAAAGVTSVVAIAGATANFDAVIPAGTVRRFAIPVEVANSEAASVQGVNRSEGLYNRVAWKTQGISSVFANEY